MVIAPADFRGFGGLLAGQGHHYTSYTFIFILHWLESARIRVSTTINSLDDHNVDSVAGKRQRNEWRRFHLASLDGFSKSRHTKTHHLHLH